MYSVGPLGVFVVNPPASPGHALNDAGAYTQEKGAKKAKGQKK